MSFFSRSSSSTLASNNNNPAEKDIEVAQPPTDSISAVAFSPTADYLAVGSWDNNVRIYEVGPNGETQGRAMYSHQGPVLSVCWNKDGSKLMSGGADNTVQIFDMATGRASAGPRHDGPIRAVRWIESPQGGVLATGSWDKTVKYWDLQTPNHPVATVQLPERCYTMDIVYPLMVVGTAERHILVINLQNPTTPLKTLVSPLRWQTRIVSCFPTADGFAVGSIEGRVAIQYVDDKDSTNNFSFKCHRADSTRNARDQSSLVYSVNDICFHPVHGTLSTCGSDGVLNYWDKDSHTRLKSNETALGPMPCMSFNHSGKLHAYAVSYDWSKGHSGMTPGQSSKLMLHQCKDDEVKPKPSKR